MNYCDILGKKVRVAIDRKIGDRHPDYSDVVYEVNYGYIEGVVGGDGEEQDVYVLGVNHPIDFFHGVITAIICRLNDNEDKWVAIPENVTVTDSEIIAKTRFQEKYFDIRLIR